jgi:sodium transport system ATP-binding protein
VVRTFGLTKRFHDRKRGEVLAAENLNLEVRPGEIFGLLGPNGAGKTTTLRMLATIFKPTQGTALVFGHDVMEEPERVRARIGFLTGETGLYKRLTPVEILRYFASLQGAGGAETRQRIEGLIERFDMGSYRDVRIGKLSKGMKQKVSIARTLVHDPELLILDEPTQGLDAVTARGLLDHIRDLKEDGKTIVFSTHIMREAERICDRFSIIREGRIVFTGTKEELLLLTKDEDFEDAFIRLIC